MMPTPEERENLKGSKVETLPNGDHLLSDEEIILKYQLQFTKYFGPDYAYGVAGIGREWSSRKGREDLFRIRARVKTAYQSTKGKQTFFEVPMNKFKVWRQNINLYEFISVK